MNEKDIVITYDTLFDLARRERYRSELQALDEKFFNDVVKYLEEKNSILKSQEENKSVFAGTEAEKTKSQIVNAKKILKELYERREAKIIQAALFHSRNENKPYDFTGMLSQEISLFKSVEKTLMGFRQDILYSLLSHQIPQKVDQPKALKTEPSKEDKGSFICFKCNVPEFVGPDMKTYGPYSENDEAELPDEISEMLIKNGNAVRQEK